MKYTLTNILAGSFQYLNSQLIKLECQLRSGNSSSNLVKSSINFVSSDEDLMLFKLPSDQIMSFYTLSLILNLKLKYSPKVKLINPKIIQFT